jgi:Transcriptional regulatory protein, C terminal
MKSRVDYCQFLWVDRKMERNSQQPLSYRADLLKKVIAQLLAGECCSLVGVGSVGKSNLARFLQRRDVQLHYWGEKPVWVLLIDTQGMIFDDGKIEYAVLELMAHQLLTEAVKRASVPSWLEKVQTLYASLTEGMTAQQALRVLENICRHICADKDVQIIFLFDQFDYVWQNGGERLFVNLRYLRDTFKYQILYLVMTRGRLNTLRDDLEAVETFWELFSAHTFGLGPYNEQDAAFVVAQLAARAGITIDATLEAQMLELSGRHPGLLRAIFWAHYNAPRGALDVETLLQTVSITDECRKIWESLLLVEQQGLRLLLQMEGADQSVQATLADLRLKGVISGEPPTFFAPLFVAYLRSIIGERRLGVSIDVRRRQVWLDGRLLQQPLAPLEFKLLEYLVRHSGEVCQNTDLTQELYDDKGQAHNDQRLYAVLARLRRAMGDDARHPHYLVTHRGGIQLVKGDVVGEAGT